MIFSYIRRLGLFLGVQNFEFQYFWRFQKKKNFWGMKILWIFFGGHHKIGLQCILGSFLKVQNGGIFGGLLKFQIFFGGA